MLIREYERKVLTFDSEKEMLKALAEYENSDWRIISYGKTLLSDNEFNFKLEHRKIYR